MRIEPATDGPMVPHEGHNAHFWPKAGFYKVDGRLRAVMSIVQTRLVLANPKAELATLPMPPDSELRLPDRSYPSR